MLMSNEVVLHTYFIERFILSIPFLVPLIITWITYRSAPKIILRPLSYIFIGFLLGFIIQVILDVIFVYVIQLPLLPLKLHQEGLSPKEIAMIISMYNILSMVTYVATLLTSLTLVGYGVYRLVNIVKNTKNTFKNS